MQIGNKYQCHCLFAHVRLFNWITVLFLKAVCGLTVACWVTDHYHPCSNLGVGISEGCFIFDFASLPLEVARPILSAYLAYRVHKSGLKLSII